MELKKVTIIVSVVMLLSAVVLTVGCSDDDATGRRDAVTVELAPYASGYTEKESVSVGTRAGDPSSPVWAPRDYYLYEYLEGASGVYISNVNSAIGAFFTNGTSHNVRKFHYDRSRGKWLIDEPLEDASDNNYYLYGIVPYNAADVTINPLDGDYSNGAVMIMNGLTSVMNQDPCIVVGAKHGSKADDDTPPEPSVNPMRLGDFNCNFRVSSSVEQNSPNYLFLLFDHLYAALRFRFRVDDKYAGLRSIRLKRLEMMAYQDQDCTRPAQKNVQTTVTLKANNTGESPIFSIQFTPTGEQMNENDYALVYENQEGKLIPTGNDYTDNLGFVPKMNSYFKLRSTYDVYDTNTKLDSKGNLIRNGCVAENKIDPTRLFQTESLDRGNLYTLKLTIKPTYLYMLSEPDLDNPTVTVGE